MPERLGQLKAERKTGVEQLHQDGTGLGFNLLDFWRWSASDLVSNATRGILAEYLVARALEIPSDGIRDEWAAFDLLTASGLRIEVKPKSTEGMTMQQRNGR